jgi:YHS domain-containing protein
MSRSARIAIVLGLFGAAVMAAVMAPPIPQDPAYHHLADARAFFGVPSALNVISNVPFVLVGALGAWAVRPGGGGTARFIDGRERWPWMVFFTGFLLTGFGSAYYHLYPNNQRLVWDRLPLAAALMGLFAAIIAERIGVRAGVALLAPLVVAGLGSVLWWHGGEVRGHGDLRPYALVQFYPLVAVPLMLYLFGPRYTLGGAVLTTVAVYGLAKVFEVLDGPIFAMGSVVSGHTLKHLAAGTAGYVIVWMLTTRRPVPDSSEACDDRHAMMSLRGGQAMATDPVCHMDVDPKRAAAQSSYKGETIYFCASGCKTKFDADPERYLPASK